MDEWNADQLGFEQLGFIHDKLDIKILLLTLLCRLPRPVGLEDLYELCSRVDSGVSYFDYCECLSELTGLGMLTRDEDGGYAVSEKGAANAEALEISLPYSVRSRASEFTEEECTRLRSLPLISARVEKTETGPVVKLSYAGGERQCITMELLCENEKQAERIRRNFRSRAESMRLAILRLLEQ